MARKYVESTTALTSSILLSVTNDSVGRIVYVHKETVLIDHPVVHRQRRCAPGTHKGVGVQSTAGHQCDRDQGWMHMAAWPQRDVAGGGGPENFGWSQAVCLVGGPWVRACVRVVFLPWHLLKSHAPICAGGRERDGAGLFNGGISLVWSAAPCSAGSFVTPSPCRPPVDQLALHEELLTIKVKQTDACGLARWNPKICLFHREHADSLAVIPWPVRSGPDRAPLCLLASLSVGQQPCPFTV